MKVYSKPSVDLRKFESKKLSAKTSISGIWLCRSPIRRGGTTTQNSKRTDLTYYFLLFSFLVLCFSLDIDFFPTSGLICAVVFGCEYNSSRLQISEYIPPPPPCLRPRGSLPRQKFSRLTVYSLILTVQLWILQLV